LKQHDLKRHGGDRDRPPAAPAALTAL